MTVVYTLMAPEILSEEIIHQQGSFRRVKRWLRGCHPDLGLIINGDTGVETVVELDIIKPTCVVNVYD